MLERLSSRLEPEGDEDCLVRLDSLAFVEDGGLLTLSVRDSRGLGSRWEVKATGLRDYRVAQCHGDLVLHERDHVAARQHTDTQQALYFAGVHPAVEETAGRLLLVHRAVAGSWIPFGRYLNSCRELEDLLRGGFGLLADGPSFLIVAYAEVLTAEGLDPSLLAPRPARFWRGEVIVGWSGRRRWQP
jgi:hypothetical protein